MRSSILLVAAASMLDIAASAENITPFECPVGTPRWVSMGTGVTDSSSSMPGLVNDILHVGPGSALPEGLYVCGNFDTAGFGTAYGIARWGQLSTGAMTWLPLTGGTGLQNGVTTPGGGGWCNSMTIGSDGMLYIGGDFSFADGAPAAHTGASTHVDEV